MYKTKSDIDVLVSIVLMVVDKPDEEIEEFISTLTDEQCSQLEQWASREYLVANDNPLPRKHKPVFVQEWLGE